MQHHPRWNPPAQGQTVILADGDEVGTVEAVIEPQDPSTETIIIVNAVGASEHDHLCIPQAAVHVVTEHDVILGTTAHWLAQLVCDNPPLVS